MKKIIFIINFALMFHSGPVGIAQQDYPDRASLSGQYDGLIQKFSCPQDKNNYVPFMEYGYWSGTEYCGQETKTGWWVYLYPDWYVWKNNSMAPKTDPESAAFDGAYSELMQTVLCPQDSGQYGMHYEYGYWNEGSSYCGQQVSQGYWVFHHPYWYIWKDKKNP